jgi:hypothetical protein
VNVVGHDPQQAGSSRTEQVSSASVLIAALAFLAVGTALVMLIGAGSFHEACRAKARATRTPGAVTRVHSRLMRAVCRTRTLEHAMPSAVSAEPVISSTFASNYGARSVSRGPGRRPDRARRAGSRTARAGRVRSGRGLGPCVRCRPIGQAHRARHSSTARSADRGCGSVSAARCGRDLRDQCRGLSHDRIGEHASIHPHTRACSWRPNPGRDARVEIVARVMARRDRRS